MAMLPIGLGRGHFLLRKNLKVVCGARHSGIGFCCSFPRIDNNISYRPKTSGLDHPHRGLFPLSRDFHPIQGGGKFSGVIPRSNAFNAAMPTNPDQSDGFWSNLFNKLMRWTIGLFLAGCCLVAALPAILSNKTGLAVTKAVANVFIPGVVEVRDVDMAWGKPINVKGVELKEDSKSEVVVVGIEQITTTENLWDVVIGKDFDMVVTDLMIDAAPDSKGEIPLVRYAEKAGMMKKSKVEKTELQTDQRKLVSMSGEVKNGNSNVYVNDGRLFVGDELRYTIGKQIHWLIAQGDETVASVSDEIDMEADWLEAEEKPKDSEALLVTVNSPNVGLDMKGWKTADGILLGEPATAIAQFTPLLAREGLSKINPLLGETMKMSKGAKVRVQVASPDMRLPSKTVQLHMDPVQVVIDSGPLANGLLDLLDVQERGLSKGKPLQAWMSGVDIEVRNEEMIRVRRCDMLLGKPGKGIHVVVWGECNSLTKELNMNLGIPADALARAGIEVEPGYILPLPLRGTTEEPIVNWTSASKDIGRLALERVGGMIAGEEGTIGGFMRNAFFDVAKGMVGKKHGQGNIPELTEPLPWE
ncbi:hypothetical protein BSKO_06454 [Bryopsis sp. KO-2023]|nr:hypothetical protein BSKO_06454 [Bryopsis sp. KO-2023]